MTVLRKALYGALTVLLACAGVAWLMQRHYQGTAQRMIDLATQQAAQIETLKEQSGEREAIANSWAQAAAKHEAEAAKLKAKLRASQGPSALPSIPPAPVADGGLGIEQPGNGSVGDDATSIRDQIIAAQDQQITALQGENLELRAALDATGKALATSEQRARGLEIALDAQKHAAKSSKWLGRFQGFAWGVGAGYVAGRIH